MTDITVSIIKLLETRKQSNIKAFVLKDAKNHSCNQLKESLLLDVNKLVNQRSDRVRTKRKKIDL